MARKKNQPSLDTSVLAELAQVRYPNYESLKEMANSLARPVSSLLALSPNNDPFYCGMPAQRKKAQWFAEQWRSLDLRKGAHLRLMHYAIVSQREPVKMVNGKPYENTIACWEELLESSQAARYLDLIDPEWIVDRKNASATDFVDYGSGIAQSVWTSESDAEIYRVVLPEFPDLPSYSSLILTHQAYHLELWCEKSTQDGILRPLAQEYKLALQYGEGELSITMALEALRRFERARKPVRIFYISDFDPAGVDMPKSMAAKLQYYNVKWGLDLDIRLYPIVLTAEQAKHYNLPRTPIKDSDVRKTKFEQRFGVGATELDALEALHRGELRRILTREIERYYDPTLNRRANQVGWAIKERMEEETAQVLDPYLRGIKGLRDEWETICNEFNAQFDQRIEQHMQRREEIWTSLITDLQANEPTIEDDEVPIPREANEIGQALFDSTRSYLEQNNVYQAYKGKDIEESA
jgi:hypothetical protein